MQVAGVILAGGQSRRMDGRDKAMLPFGDRRLIDHVHDRLAQQIETIAINSNGDPAVFGHLETSVVPDDIPGFVGPLAGILSGMEWAAAQSSPFSHVLTVATDTPFFPADFALALQEAVIDAPGTIGIAASGGRVHPTFGLWPVALRADLRRWLSEPSNRRVTAFVDRHPHRIVEFQPVMAQGGETVDPFFNINTPQEAAEARQRWITAR